MSVLAYCKEHMPQVLFLIFRYLGMQLSVASHTDCPVGHMAYM